MWTLGLRVCWGALVFEMRLDRRELGKGWKLARVLARGGAATRHVHCRQGMGRINAGTDGTIRDLNWTAVWTRDDANVSRSVNVVRCVVVVDVYATRVIAMVYRGRYGLGWLGRHTWPGVHGRQRVVTMEVR